MEIIYTYYFAVSRWLIPLFSLLLMFLWFKYFHKIKSKPFPLAELTTKDGLSISVYGKENLIGRTKRADIVIPLENVHTKHAILFIKKHRWWLAPLDGKVSVNLQNLTAPAPLDYGDKVEICKQTLTFKRKEVPKASSLATSAGLPMVTLIAIQLMVFIAIMLKFNTALPLIAVVCFALLLVGEWLYFIVGLFIKNFTMLTEIPVLFMTTFGLAITCSISPENLTKHLVCYVAGFLGYILLTVFLKSPELCTKLQRPVMFLTLFVLYYTAFFGTVAGGARNWLSFGSFSFQPSELCKPLFVFCGGKMLYDIVKKSALKIEFFIFAMLSVGALAIMFDFGAAAIFFAGMLIILTVRLYSPIFVFGITGGAVLGILLVSLLVPYVARRFGVWLHAWEYPDSLGYQQTRTMIAFASGGLLGVGPGEGFLSYISAADTDLVFGILGEEWGAIVAVCVAFCVALVAIYAVRLAKQADSTFYSITALSAAVMLIIQSALNIFGSLDLLPLTGVTLIFVSKGGSSIISALLFMAFFKAAELHKKPVSDWRYEDEVD